jgi:hypothetical protein
MNPRDPLVRVTRVLANSRVRVEPNSRYRTIALGQYTEVHIVLASPVAHGRVPTALEIARRSVPGLSLASPAGRGRMPLSNVTRMGACDGLEQLKKSVAARQSR